MAISTAVFPRLAEQAVNDEAELRSTLARALRLILYLTIPATLGLMVIAGPLTTLLLRGGEFGAGSGDLVVGALVLYALGLFAHSGIEILSRGFYALADTRTPVTFALVSMAVNLVLSVALVRAFDVNGLALALSIAAIVEFGLLGRALAERLRGLDNARLARSAATTLAASLLMAELVALWLLCLRGAGLLESGNKLMAGVAILGALAIGVPVFYGVTRLLGSREATILVERLPLPTRVRRLAGVAGSP
jgi:putative peptidoglycan lipid II flippase